MTPHSHLTPLLLACVAAIAFAASDAPTAPCRNVTAWPFAATSVWNTPVGSAAKYSAVHIFQNHTPKNVFTDDDYMIVTRSTDPEVLWYSQGWWNSTDHCERFPWSTLVGKLHWPANLTVTAFGNNNAAAILQPDNVTLILTQPLYKCNESWPVLSLHDPWHGNCSILENCTYGGHGGSTLNAIGGSLRVGELLPGVDAPRHVLKLQLFAHQYYYGAKGGANRSTCYTWPALNCDGYFSDCSNPDSYNCYGGLNELVRPGALLAIVPADLAGLNLTTQPAKMLAWTLTNFGGLLCDDTYDDRVTINVEKGFENSFGAAWGFAFQASSGPWFEDVLTIFRALNVVVSNTVATPGGGGTPLQPPPPPFCPQ